MAKVKRSSENSITRRGRTPLTPEARENQMVSLAMDLAERQLREGTASSQVITHFLKLGTEKAKQETEKLKKENNLLTAKTNFIESSERLEEITQRAIDAITTYKGGIDE